MTGKASDDGDLLGSADIQSLADLANGFDRTEKMKVFPAKRSSILKIVLAGLIPFLPLAALVIPVDEIAKALIGLVL